MPADYLIVRDANESKRLNKQNEAWNKTLGYHIHPSIAKTLPASNVRIADVGCGTGIWLIDIALAMNNLSWQFDGFDVSQKQFPLHSSSATSEAGITQEAASTTTTVATGITAPPNVDFHVQNMRDPFPPHFCSQYDLVHIRLVLAALDPHEWGHVAANLRTLLKPGGWIQWEELDIAQFQTPLRAGPILLDNKDTYLRKGMHHLIAMTKHRTKDVHLKVLHACHEANFQNIETDVVSSDRLPELRETMTLVQMQVVQSIGKKKLEDGVSGAWSIEELEHVGREMEKEVNRGMYVNHNIQCVIGRR